VFGDQPGQDAPLPRPANVGWDVVDDDLQRAEHPDPDHTHLADEEDNPHPGASATGPQAGRKSATSEPSHARYMTTAPQGALKTRTAKEPDQALRQVFGGSPPAPARSPHGTSPLRGGNHDRQNSHTP
jgi:hypothetical protein